MSELNTPAALVVWGGFVLAFLFGAIANKTNFCTMGAISDIVNMEHWGRMRMWLLTIAIAVLGANLLYYVGWIDLSKSVYQRPILPWLSLLLGGFLFGVGMTIAAGCTNKNLVRLGGGSLRSLVVLVFLSISAYMTLKGLFGHWRVSYLDPIAIDMARWNLSSQGVPQIVSKLTGLSEKSALLTCSLVVGLGLMGFALKDRRFRANLTQVAGGAITRIAHRSCLVPHGTYRPRRKPRYARDGVLRHQYPDTRIDELCGAHRIQSGTADAVVRQDPACDVRYRNGGGCCTWVIRLCRQHATVPLGRLCLAGRFANPVGRRGTYGIRRRDCDRLHDRPGPFRHLHPGFGIVHCACRDHQRGCGHDEMATTVKRALTRCAGWMRRHTQ
jgi:uncharacterized membrane protein YedE/YeeE